MVRKDLSSFLSRHHRDKSKLVDGVSISKIVPFDRAMEEKKRAMAAAEEQRRRKALEDRRQSQQQATDRFRSAMGRIKNPTPAGRRLYFPGISVVLHAWSDLI